jgi:hypothetical protein
MISRAYPDKSRKKDTLLLYQRFLSDIPPYILQEAADRHIRSSSWFPSIAELRAISANIANLPPGGSFASVPFESTNLLRAERIELERLFYHEGEFDEARWLSLIRQLENLDRPFAAAEAREHFDFFKKLIAEEEKE